MSENKANPNGRVLFLNTQTVVMSRLRFELSVQWRDNIVNGDVA